MSIRSRHLVVGGAIGLVLLVASCNRSPTSPRPAPQPGQPTTTVVVVRLELVVPGEIEPGESVQLTANAVKSDGSVENVSSQTQWTPTTSQIVQLSATGLATGKTRGEFFLTARYGSRTATARIFVLPKGTFRLAGTIQESGLGLTNVAVTVISGVGEGLTTVSGFNGFYALYGVSGPVRIHAKKDGYLNGIQGVDVTAHRTFDFNMVAERQRQDYRGTYTLTFSASPCRFGSGVLPEDAKRRVYTANVTQDIGRLTVALSGAEFIVSNGHGDRFSGYVDPADVMTFQIGSSDYYYYYSGIFDIAERFSGTALLFTGTVSAKGAPTRISGTLAGSIMVARTAIPPFFQFSAMCYADTHGFEMVRR